MSLTMEQRESKLKFLVDEKLPNFKKLCEQNEANDIIFHQDAYAASYQEEEYMLLGMAIKYAGLYGKSVHITGTNRETLVK